MPVIPISTIHITRHDFNELRRLQRRKRWDWPAVFSVNPRGVIWPFVTNGWTPEDERIDVAGVSPIVDRVASEYLDIRPEGGRFFIKDCGAFFKTEDGGPPQLFAVFLFG